MSIGNRLRAALVRRSFTELGDRALQASRAAIERAGLSADTAAPTMNDWRMELRASNGERYADARAALDTFRSGARNRFFAGTADVADTIAAIRAADPGAEARTLELAGAAAIGRPRLLGYEALDFGSPPDWHLDPVHRRRAPLAHWSKIRYLDEGVVGDHKIVWELNRHQWLLHLAKAYHFSREGRWAEQVFVHIDAWIEANPPKRGINWASSLEIALRAIAWLWVLYLLRGADALTPERFARIVRVLGIGGRHIEQHLSTWFSPNTHLTGEALGLLYLGCALPDLNDAVRWRRLGMAILADRTPQHLRPDGSYVEQSTHYARYSVDFLIHAVTLAQRSRMDVPLQMRDLLACGAGFLRHLSRPDGTLPLLGDDDGGRLLFLDPRPADNVYPTLATATAIIGDPTLSCPASAPSEEVAWLLGPAALRAAHAGSGVYPARGSRVFSDGGFAALRDGWSSDASVAVMDCGMHGMGNGGHAHADLGSIDLTIRGRPLIVDPGTWSYVMRDGARDHFRRAEAHAVPMVDGQGSAAPAEAFSWARYPRVSKCSAYLSTQCDAVGFSHDGFHHLDDPVAHRRTVVRVGRGYWLVVDVFSGVLQHRVSISYPLAPQLRAVVDGMHVTISDSRHAPVARFISSASYGEWQLCDAWASNAYGRREPTVRLVQQMSFTGELVGATLVQAADEPAVSSLQVERGEGAVVIAIERAAGAPDVLRLRDDYGSLVEATGSRTEWRWRACAVSAA
jgi:hypothetical protein